MVNIPLTRKIVEKHYFPRSDVPSLTSVDRAASKINEPSLHKYLGLLRLKHSRCASFINSCIRVRGTHNHRNTQAVNKAKVDIEI